MIRNQPHNTYRGRIVILMKTILTRGGLQILAATRADILQSTTEGLKLHCKCATCGSHYTIDRVAHDDVLLLAEKDQQR